MQILQPGLGSSLHLLRGAFWMFGTFQKKRAARMRRRDRCFRYAPRVWDTEPKHRSVSPACLLSRQMTPRALVLPRLPKRRRFQLLSTLIQRDSEIVGDRSKSATKTTILVAAAAHAWAAHFGSRLQRAPVTFFAFPHAGRNLPRSWFLVSVHSTVLYC